MSFKTSTQEYNKKYSNEHLTMKFKKNTMCDKYRSQLSPGHQVYIMNCIKAKRK